MTYDYHTIALACKYDKKELENKLKEVSNLKYHEIIIDAVCRLVEVNVEDVFTRSRKSQIVKARQLSMYFMLKYNSNLTVTQVGRLFKRDHATVLHSKKVVIDSLIMPDFKDIYNRIDKRIRRLLCK
jgi:chromosomal replication initiator protein